MRVNVRKDRVRENDLQYARVCVCLRHCVSVRVVRVFLPENLSCSECEENRRRIFFVCWLGREFQNDDMAVLSIADLVRLYFLHLFDLDLCSQAKKEIFFISFEPRSLSFSSATVFQSIVSKKLRLERRKVPDSFRVRRSVFVGSGLRRFSHTLQILLKKF